MEDYFNDDTDIESLVFLKLAIHCIKQLYPDTVFIAEDASGFPLLAASQSAGGIGFDYVHAMHCPDLIGWVACHYREHGTVTMAKEIASKLLLRKPSEKYVAYAECHDQCFKGGLTLLHRLLGHKSRLAITSIFEHASRLPGS